MDRADEIAERLRELARISDTEEGVTRLPWTEAHRKALNRLGAWMEEAGLETRLDAAGTLIGRSVGPADRPVLFLGSHQDSVKSGGAYDGAMGIVLAIEAARALRDRHADLPVTLEILAFADEEGVRFPTALIGPRALAGTFDVGTLDLKDANGTRMGDAMRDFGLDPDVIAEVARDPATVAGYLECHIEQGPVLEREDRPAGIVTAICGISRTEIEFTGETGHAGTVPMQGRRDALVAAARLIDRVSSEAIGADDLRATVGRLDLAPGVVNAIPARTVLSLEIRSPHDATRENFEARAREMIDMIASETGCVSSVERTYVQPAVECDKSLQNALAAAMQDVDLEPFHLPSGATHDASAMVGLCPPAMLFLRCHRGISHHPDEHADPDDMALAARILSGAVLEFAASETRRDL